MNNLTDEQRYKYGLERCIAAAFPPHRLRIPARVSCAPQCEVQSVQTFFGPIAEEASTHPLGDIPVDESANRLGTSVASTEWQRYLATVANHFPTGGPAISERIDAIMNEHPLDWAKRTVRTCAILKDQPPLLRELNPFLPSSYRFLITTDPNKELTFVTVLAPEGSYSWIPDTTHANVSPVPSPPPPPPPAVPHAPATKTRTLSQITLPPPLKRAQAAPTYRHVLTSDTDFLPRLAKSSEIIALVETQLAHQPDVYERFLRTVARLCPDDVRPSGLRPLSAIVGDAAFYLASASLSRPAEVRSVGLVLLDEPRLLRALADLVSGEDARAEIARIVEIAQARETRAARGGKN